MHIYVKTSPYQHNSYIQHLIEHLVCKRKSIENFFTYDFPVRADSHLGYSSFYCNHLDKDQILSQIFSPLDLSMVRGEKKLIQEECGGYSSDKTLLVNRLGKMLYGASFGRAKPSFPCSQALISQEHKNYYHLENTWITDNDFKILQRPQHITQKASLHLTNEISDYNFCIRKTNYFVKVFKEKNPADYALCYFLDWLVFLWSQYFHNHLGKNYDFPSLEFFEYETSLALIFSSEDRAFYNTPIDPIFYEHAKQYFLKNPEYLQEVALIAEIRLEQVVDCEDLTQFVSSLDLKQVQNYLQYSF